MTVFIAHQNDKILGVYSILDNAYRKIVREREIYQKSIMGIELGNNFYITEHEVLDKLEKEYNK